MRFNLALKLYDLGFECGQGLLIPFVEFNHAVGDAVAHRLIERIDTADNRSVPFTVQEQFHALSFCQLGIFGVESNELRLF